MRTSQHARWEMAGGGAVDAAPSGPAFQALGTFTFGLGAINPPWPAHQPLDVGLLFVETANQPIAIPAGWNAVASQGTGTPGAATTATCLQIFWARATTSSEPAAPVLGVGDHQVAAILTFRGVVASGNPVNVSAGSTDTNTAVLIPGATTTLDNCLVVAAMTYAGDVDTNNLLGVASNANLVNLAKRLQSTSSIGNGGGIGVITGTKLVAGPYGTTTSSTSGSVMGLISLALAPA